MRKANGRHVARFAASGRRRMAFSRSLPLSGEGQPRQSTRYQNGKPCEFWCAVAARGGEKQLSAPLARRNLQQYSSGGASGFAGQGDQNSRGTGTIHWPTSPTSRMPKLDHCGHQAMDRPCWIKVLEEGTAAYRDLARLRRGLLRGVDSGEAEGGEVARRPVAGRSRDDVKDGAIVGSA